MWDLRAVFFSSLAIDLKGVLRDGVNYFRIAYERNGMSMDFSDPIVRWENGTWGGMGEPVDLFRV